MGLVLRRNKGQSIEIFDPVDESLGVITITARGHGNIEIDAPKHLSVKRSELEERFAKSESKPVTKKLSATG
jgi:sRNA-binding carbon storage regulator CsrA